MKDKYKAKACLQSLCTIFACSCGSTTTCMPCSPPRYSTTEWNSGMSSSPSFLSTITLRTHERSHNAANWATRKRLALMTQQIRATDTSTHHDGLVFQTSRCCCVLGQEKDRHPDAAGEHQAVTITTCLLLRYYTGPKSCNIAASVPLTVSLAQLMPSVLTR